MDFGPANVGDLDDLSLDLTPPTLPVRDPAPPEVGDQATMATLYWLSLVVGGGLVLLSVFGDLLHVDLPDFPSDADAWHVLSLRGATYFLFAFGATGLLASGAGAGTALVAASFAGVAAAALSSAVFRYLQGTESGGVPDDASLVGLAGRVVLPLQEGGTGKVVVSRGGREVELLARPFDAEPGSAVESWTEVVIVDVDGGTALVAPYSDAPRLPASEA
jgi:hypothetical protein